MSAPLNGNLNNWARAIAMVGIPGVIALALVWVMGREIPNIVRVGQQNHELLLQIGREQKEAQRMLREQNEIMEELFRMMQRVCANTAKDNAGAVRCFDK